MLAHDHDGSGDSTLLLLHAGCADRRMWDPQWAEWTSQHRVVRVDLRGYGDSPVPDHDWCAADDVVDVLDHLGLDQVTAVGSSYGGRVATELATRHPRRVAALLLLNPAQADLPPTDALKRFAAQEEALLGTGDVAAAVELNLRTWLGPEAEPSVREQLRMMQERAFAVQLAADADPARSSVGSTHVPVDPAAIGVPTVVVTGARDLDHFQTVARRLADGLPKGRLVDLPWAGHLPSLERPNSVLDLLPLG